MNLHTNTRFNPVTKKMEGSATGYFNSDFFDLKAILFRASEIKSLNQNNDKELNELEDAAEHIRSVIINAEIKAAYSCYTVFKRKYKDLLLLIDLGDGRSIVFNKLSLLEKLDYKVNSKTPKYAIIHTSHEREELICKIKSIIGIAIIELNV